MIGLLKNWKLILGMVAFATVSFFLFDYQRVKSNYETIETSLSESLEESKNLEREYKNLETSLEDYRLSLSLAQESSKQLQKQLEIEAEKDEKLEQCLNTTLPPTIIDSLSK